MHQLVKRGNVATMSGNEAGREAQEGLELQKLQSYLSSLDGVEAYVIVEEEGFPVAYKGLTQDEAEALAAMTVDIRVAMEALLVTPTTQVFSGWNPRNITISLEGGDTIEIAKVRGLLLTIKGREEPLEEAVKAILMRAEGKSVTCPHCGYDLTLSIAECKRCKRKIPFTSKTCPHCGANTSVKPCPNCGKPVTHDGRKPELARPSDIPVIAGLEGLAGGVGLGVVTLAATSSLPLALGVGVASGVVIAKFVYDRLRAVSQV